MPKLVSKAEGGSQIKAIARNILPHAIYGQGSQIWQGIRWHSRALKMAASLGLPDVLLYFGKAPGDDLLCTAILRELRKRGGSKSWIMSNHPSLFENNPDVHKVVPADLLYEQFAHTWRRKYHYLEYSTYLREEDKSIPPQRHIIAELCSRVGIQGKITTLRPYFHLKDDERRIGGWSNGMIAIQSSGLAGQYPMRNKQWFPERFQEVVNGLSDKYKFVQIGSAADPALSGVMDMRGKTSLRETAALLANCHLYIGNIGFLMHLARAVECPSVIVYGGREAPWQSGYSCNLNLYSALPCAPCWLWNNCDYDRVCMKNITSGDAIRAVEEILARPRNPLPEDYFEL